MTQGVQDAPRPPPPPIGTGPTLALFALTGLLLTVTMYVIVPNGGADPVRRLGLWFVFGTLLVFLPVAAIGVLLLLRERPLVRSLPERLRLKRLDATDWAWTVGSLLVAGGLGAALGLLVSGGDGRVTHNPLLAAPTLGPGRLWLVAAWVPYWVMNIAAEEFTWRGVLLPRNEAALGASAWVVHAAGWTLAHAAFGWRVLVPLLPALVLVPYVVQRRGNTWIGVIVHGVLNAVVFFAAALPTPP